MDTAAFDIDTWSAGPASTSQDALADLERLLGGPAPPPDEPMGEALLTKGKRLKSCAPCRIRRVKCDRTGDGTGDCTKCIEKALVCTPMPARAPRHGARTGKRIDLARETFGSKNDSSESITPPGFGSSTSRSSDMPSGDPILAKLSSQFTKHSAVTSRLVGSELQAAVSASLLDFYLTCQPTVPLVECTSFRSTFHSAGRRLEALDPQSQVLYSLIIALGARNSDHPLLVGPNAPTFDSLAESTRSGKDLRDFGRRREDACRALEQQAIELADRMGTLRIANRENMASLMLLESMVEQEDVSHSAVRPFVNAYQGHARTLLENGDLIAGTLIGWTAFLRDALKSAASGHSPLFSDDDVFLLTQEFALKVGEPTSLDEALARPLSENHELNFWILMGSFMVEIGEFARSIAAKLTGRRARSKPRVDEEFIREYMEFLDVAWKALTVLEERSHLFVSTPIPGRKGDTVESTVRSMSVTTSNLWQRLVDLRKQTYHRAFLASRNLVRLCGAVLAKGVNLGANDWLDSRAAQMLFATLPAWLSGIVDTPTVEEGGPPSFTFDAKLQDLRWAQQSLYSIGWARERLSRPASWVEDEIRKLEARRSAFWTGYTPSQTPPDTHYSYTPTLGHPPPSNVPPLPAPPPIGNPGQPHLFDGFDLDLLDPFLSQSPDFLMEGQLFQQQYTPAELELILGAVTADLTAFDEGGIYEGLL
ncbi:hypothetical protein RQP46_003905 [Phenoliferia psychrophenolica]